MNLFFELHSGLPREGPGDDASTLRAIWTVAQYLPDGPSILDIGCGPGAQTLVLAKTIKQSFVTAIDAHLPFVEEVKRRAETSGLSHRIEVQQDDMQHLRFASSSFDLIWSEGAAWIMGFENAVRDWERLLKPGGCMVLSELTWITETPQSEEYDFWSSAYPGMQDDKANCATIAAVGLELLSSFHLPRESWFTEYLDPLQARAQQLLQKYKCNGDATNWIAQALREIEIARRFSGFAYIFYVMRKTA